MRYSETTEDKLRKEVEELKRQLMEQKALVQGPSPGKLWHPSPVTIGAIFLGIIVLAVIAFLAGYLPLQKRMDAIRSEVQEQEQALPRAEVVTVERSSGNSELELPGNIQAVTEAPILARADGYVRRRLADIGDRVRTGQPLAEIEAPELDQQILQAKANLQQARAALDQALANEQQGKANEELARITANRYKELTARGVATRQDNDQYQMQYAAQTANVQALEKAVVAGRSNVAAAEANVARLDDVQNYRIVKAPFDGVITLRNVDVGALVNSGNTLLFRIAQTGALRIYVNVPQTYASAVRPGQQATLSVSNLPARHFTGTVARTANALDPNSRTLLVEIQVPNADGALLPGMYAQVDLSSPRKDAPLLVPDDALIIRSEGPQVATVGPDQTVHLQKIEIGRDYGDRLEVTGGIHEGDTIIVNPSDGVRDGVRVNPVRGVEKPAGK
jgi:RND family efflux transporter MFP subunit